MSWHRWLMVVVLLVAGVLRLHGITWGLPYIVDGDEFRVIDNGLDVYYYGEQGHDIHPEMGNYPPLRSWEIAATRAVFVLLWGDEIPVPLQTLAGRLMSLGYCLLTVVFLYRLGLAFTHHPWVGIWMAGLFATLPVMTWYGQISLADGAGTFFFTACLWASIRAVQQPSAHWLSAAVILGVLATLAKYNMVFVLLIPAYAVFKHPQIILKAVPRMMIGLIPLAVLTVQTVQIENFIYDYLRPDRQMEHWDALNQTGQLDPEKQEKYTNLSRGRLERLKRNLSFLRDDLTWITLGVAVVSFSFYLTPTPLQRRGANLDTPDLPPLQRRGAYLASSSSPSLAERGLGGEVNYRPLIELLALQAVITFLVIGSLIDSGTRQLFGVVIILILFWGMGVEAIGGEWQIPLRVLAGMFLVWQGWGAWLTVDFRTLPDTRPATIEWFVDNVPSGTRLASEQVLWEFGRENGYTSQKVFLHEVLYPLERFTPYEWRCHGVEYLVWQGGFKAPSDDMLFTTKQDLYERDTEIVARFYPPHFTGPARAILQITVDC